MYPINGHKHYKATWIHAGRLGVKIATDRNLRQQITKIRKSIKSAYEDRKVQNRKEHVSSVRESENIVETYSGPWTENIIPPVQEVFVLMVLGAHGSIIIGTVAGNQLQLQTVAWRRSP